MHHPLHTLYQDRIHRFQEVAARENRILRWISFFRLATVLAMAWLAVLGVKHSQSLYYFFDLPLFALFLFQVLLYARHKDRRSLAQQHQSLNEKELACLDHDHRRLPDGSAHADAAHEWSHDLDLFGTGSLFQYMNRTATLRGEDLLARWLCTEPEGRNAVLHRQDMVRDLQDRIDLRQSFTARGRLTEESRADLEGIDRWLDDESFITRHPWLVRAALVLGGISLSILLLSIFRPGTLGYLVPVLLVNFSLLSPFFFRLSKYQENIGKKHRILRGYAALLELIAASGVKEPELDRIRETARQGGADVRSLSRLLNLFDQRLNFFATLITNGLFLSDFILVFFLERWKRNHRDDIRAWIDHIALFDVLVTLGGFAFNHPDFCWPAIGDDDGGHRRVSGLGHPLIPGKKRVTNDLELDREKVVIVTGANMAGKSTFLRALGVNQVLVYLGCPVCATAFEMPFLGLSSSMRTSDSLNDEESYFLAEIKKLQHIVKRMEEGRPMLILLDEVLKGTNTEDKRKGSVGLVHRAVGYPVTCFIATHDLSLGVLEEELKGDVTNRCFESFMDDMNLRFDYTIRKGLATNMNASYLMRKMGIMK